MKKNKCIAAIIAVCVLISGCVRIVNSYMDFSIVQFEEFLATPDDQRDSYLATGKLDYAKTGDVFFVPFIKETTHEECTLFVYTYWHDMPKEVYITDINLLDQNGVNLISCDFPSGEHKAMWQIDALSEGVFTIGSFLLNDDWYFHHNQLSVSFSVSVSTEDDTVCNDYVYEVVLHQIRRLYAPT